MKYGKIRKQRIQFLRTKKNIPVNYNVYLAINSLRQAFLVSIDRTKLVFHWLEKQGNWKTKNHFFSKNIFYSKELMNSYFIKSFNKLF